MKFFEIRYKFLLILRKFRLWLSRNLTTPIILRYGSILLIAWAIFFTPGPVSPPGQAGREPGGAAPPFAAENSPASGPVPRSSAGPPPNFLGKAALVVDPQSQVVLFERNPQERLSIASLTKLMTALVVLENKPLAEATTVSVDCTKVDGLRVNLPPGQRFTVESLLAALLLPSGADAACALAESLEGSQASPSARFVGRMNARAQSLGLASTHFTNTSGLDEESGGNYSTVADLLVLVQKDLAFAKFREIVSKSSIKIFNIDGSASLELKNTNELLEKDPGFKGVKTGSTPQALGCLAFLYERDGHQVLGIILGSPDRFADAQNLVKWVFENYVWADK